VGEFEYLRWTICGEFGGWDSGDRAEKSRVLTATRSGSPRGPKRTSRLIRWLDVDFRLTPHQTPS